MPPGAASSQTAWRVSRTPGAQRLKYSTRSRYRLAVLLPPPGASVTVASYWLNIVWRHRLFRQAPYQYSHPFWFMFSISNFFLNTTRFLVPNIQHITITHYFLRLRPTTTTNYVLNSNCPYSKTLFQAVS